MKDVEFINNSVTNINNIFKIHLMMILILLMMNQLIMILLIKQIHFMISLKLIKIQMIHLISPLIKISLLINLNKRKELLKRKLLNKIVLSNL